jgi:predicted NAD/FAD-dependent oxidoreductase
MLTPTRLPGHPAEPRRALRVAVIGAGAAGAMAARTLFDQGHTVDVFEKARGAGGRMATRRAGPLQFDHGAQYLTLRDPRLDELRTTWTEGGVLAAWRADPDPARTRWVGMPGMSAPVRQLLGEVPVHYGAEILSMRRHDGLWRLAGTAGELRGAFHAVIVAVPAPQAWALLREVAPWASALPAVAMAPCWAVMAAGAGNLPDGPPGGAEGEFPAGAPLSWAAHDAGKPGRDRNAGTWVLHASVPWSRAHLEAENASVAATLWQWFAAFSGADGTPPTFLQAHRWRHARVLEPLGTECLWDAALALGACGDWCLDGRVEAALLSGMALARQFMEDPPNSLRRRAGV